MLAQRLYASVAGDTPRGGQRPQAAMIDLNVHHRWLAHNALVSLPNERARQVHWRVRRLPPSWAAATSATY